MFQVTVTPVVSITDTFGPETLLRKGESKVFAFEIGPPFFHSKSSNILLGVRGLPMLFVYRV